MAALVKKQKKGEKLLVVDDDFSDLRTMKMALEKEGYEVFVANDGRQALELLDREKFALVLLDIRMPEISGYELLRMFKARLNGSLKIAFVSILPQKEVNLKDVDGFVQKPFSPQVLVSQVKKIIE